MPDQVVRVTNGSSLVVRTGTILGIGPSGPIGPAGPQGDKGPKGTVLYTTPIPPVTASDGDLWVDPNNGVLSTFSATTGVWTVGTTSIKGPTGSQGIIGPAGPQGTQGIPGNAANGFATFNDILIPAMRH